MSRFEPALRREPAPDLDVGHEPELVDRIRAEIEATGPITFARFMERALYEPELGYYTSGRPGPGRQGDFITAPETHPIFGRAIARQLDDAWQLLDRPGTFVVREHGAGSGALATAILDGLDADGSGLAKAIRYEPVEADPRQADAIVNRLRAAGRPAVSPTAGAFVGAVVANEVLDALPVHAVAWRDGRLRERLVSWHAGRFVEVEAEPTTPALAERLATEGVELRERQLAEICLALDSWMARVAAPLERGLVLIVDYGHPATQLYGPRRMAGSLRAYLRQRVHDDPFANVGRQDLTSHVDLTAVDRAARAAGLEALGVTTQAEFLVSLGMDDVVAAMRDAEASLEDALALRSSLARLLDPAMTGSFKVMAFGRGLPEAASLRGMRFRLRR
ncbi:MAG TPA: SAM-dependent methyltransferase [Candidatus Limnocylindrales bacterium]